MVKIGIIGAMSVEVEHLQRLLKKAEPVKKSGLSFYEGMLNGTQVVVVQCGVGKVNAALCTALLISYFGVTHVINTGVAGAVRKDLHLFDVVVSTDAVHHDVNVSAFGYKPCELPGIKRIEFPANPFLIECARRAWKKGNFSSILTEGRIASGDIFVNSAQQKEAIQALCDPACVEMEGAGVAQVCYLSAVPFVIIRCISDMAENAQEVYHEEKAAQISAFLVTHMIELAAKQS